MRKLLLAVPLFAALSIGCDNKPPVGPGEVTVTETTTSTTTTTIPVPAVASFVFSPITPEALQDVRFNASASTPASGRTIVSYAWDFGDGTLKAGVTSNHDFFPSGIYLVTLTITDDQSKTTSSSQPITVRPATPTP